METSLNNYKKIIHSQWGEEGIIEEIFKRIGTTNKQCVEFGAGNGKELSNVWYFIKDQEWNGLVMEPDEHNFNEWVTLSKEVDTITVLNTFVTIEGENSLDTILKKQHIDTHLDLLSIDIDSNDYHIFESLSDFHPRVVIIEHNPTIPPEFEAVQAPNEEANYGASAKSLVMLAHTKGYKLVATTHTNCIFVHKDDFEKIGIEEPELEDIFDRSAISYVISAVNGSTYLACQNDYPSFTYIYDSYNVYPKKDSLHTLSFGLSINKKESQTLAKQFRPIKVFWNDTNNTVNIFQFILITCKKILLVFKKIIWKKTKKQH